MKKKIIFFTKYTAAGPSSRYRSYQYQSYFQKAGYEVVFKPLFPEKYISNLYGKGRKSFLMMIPNYIKRFFQCLFLRGYDIIFIEKELLPYMPIFIERLLLWRKKNIIIDYDDAIFHLYDRSSSKIIRLLLRNKIYQLVKLADVVITGSPYLTSALKKYNSSTIEIPTSIDFDKYLSPAPAAYHQDKTSFRIAWIGSKTTSNNVVLLKKVFEQVQAKYKMVLVLIGFDKFSLPLLNDVHYEYHNWSESTEIELLKTCDAGIMPLNDNDFNKGKCGFKLIQYMACGLPTISTPLEANVKINRSGENLHASDEEEWVRAIATICEQRKYYAAEAGRNNLKIAKQYYSVQTNYKQYLEIFSRMIGKTKNKNFEHIKSYSPTI